MTGGCDWTEMTGLTETGPEYGWSWNNTCPCDTVVLRAGDAALPDTNGGVAPRWDSIPGTATLTELLAVGGSDVCAVTNSSVLATAGCVNGALPGRLIWKNDGRKRRVSMLKSPAGSDAGGVPVVGVTSE